jgi:hypothetical protein
MLTLVAYWFFTSIYIAALGHTIGEGSLTAANAGSFVFSRLLQGLALAIAGAGAGGLGARNAAMRRITQRIFRGAQAAPAIDIPPAPAQPAPRAPEIAPTSDSAPSAPSGE